MDYKIDNDRKLTVDSFFKDYQIKLDLVDLLKFIKANRRELLKKAGITIHPL